MRKRVMLLFLIPFLLFSSIPVQAENEENGWESERIYLIMIDRFNNGDPNNDFDVNSSDPLAYHGGDLKGISKKLDYIKDMGFTSILLTPIFQNSPDGYDGYSIEDYYNVDEHFGTLKEFKQLVSEAHKKDMKIIVELGLQKQVQSLDEDLLIDAAKWWIEETNIDGYSVDSVDLLSKSIIENLSETVKSVKGNFILVGVPSTMSEEVEDLTSVGIDVVVNSSLFNGVRNTYYLTDETFDEAEDIWQVNNEKSSNPYLLANMIDNHFTSRFTYLATEQNEHPAPRIKLALSYLYTTPGIPVMYYGTEIALNGAEPPANRMLMNFQTDKELVDYITLLGKVRQGLPSLTKGDFQVLSNKDGMIVFKREYQGETVVVAINNSSKTQKVVLDENQIDTSKELRGLLEDELVRPIDNEFNVVVDRDLAQIYVVQNNTGINYGFLAVIVLIPILMIAFLIINKRRNSNRTEQ